MSTGIEWTDETWNPLTGCTKVSPGCDHCYAKTMHERFNGPGSFDTVTLRPERLVQPFSWRAPRKVFVNSMSDLFHDAVPDEYIARVFAVMALSPQHTFQVLTKRHARMRSLLSKPEFARFVAYTAGYAFALVRDRKGKLTTRPRLDSSQIHDPVLPLANVWLGVSVENQQWADIRIPALLETPAAVRFLSCEPLLGPIDLFNGVFDDDDGQKPGPAVVSTGHSARTDYGTGVEYDVQHEPGIDWVIVGGESGRGARPMHPDWARSLRDQCETAGVPYLFKQWGEFVVEDQSPQDITLPGVSRLLLGDPGPSFYKVGKHAAGRELDGRTWDEYPAVAS